MKTWIIILMSSIFFSGDLSVDTLSAIKQNTKKTQKKCVNGVTFNNVTSSALTIMYCTEVTPLYQSITIPANTSVPIFAGPWGDDPGSWTFRIPNGLDGSIACFEQNTGVKGCVTTYSDGRYYTIFNPFNGYCGTSFEFVFADYPQCN